jgi:hypothetical protein
MHKSRVLDLLPDDEPAAEGATEATTDAQSPWGNGVAQGLFVLRGR